MVRGRLEILTQVSAALETFKKGLEAGNAVMLERLQPSIDDIIDRVAKGQTPCPEIYKPVFQAKAALSLKDAPACQAHLRAFIKAAASGGLISQVQSVVGSVKLFLQTNEWMRAEWLKNRIERIEQTLGTETYPGITTIKKPLSKARAALSRGDLAVCEKLLVNLDATAKMLHAQEKYEIATIVPRYTAGLTNL